MKKNKLAFLISTLDTGGAERQLVNTLNSLDQNKFEIEVFVLKNKCEIKNQIDREIPINILSIGSYANPLNIIKVIKAIKKYNPDILHSVMYASNLIARMYKIFNRRVKVINHIHGIGSWIKKKHIFIDRLLLKFVDKILVVSEKSKEIRLSREQYPVNKLEVIYNSIDTKMYHFDERDHAKKTIVIGTASRLVSLKQIDLGIEILNKVKSLGIDLKFIIAGNGPVKNNLIELVNRIEASSFVEFKGHTIDMPGFYKSIDCFALFSRTEDMPLSIVEAMASGLPIIASNVGGVSELLDGNCGLLIDVKTDIEEIAKHIYSFLEECDFSSASKQNKNYVTSKFDNKQHRESIEKLYLSLM